MRIDRKDLLHRLLCVSPGLSKQEVILQSGCVILRSGWMYTMSAEIACALPSKLDRDVDCALKADKLISLLKLLPDDEIELSFDKNHLLLNGNGKRRLKAPLEAQVRLPVEEVELPEKWKPLHEDFSEAVDLVNRCAKKRDEESMAMECIHMTPAFLEACDNSRMIRYSVPTFVEKEILVRAATIKEMAQLGMTKAAETDNWLHFKNPMSLRLSVKKHVLEYYPDLGSVVKKRGKLISFPKGLKDVAERAGLYAEDGVRFQMSRDGMLVTGESVDGKYDEDVDSRYNGEDLSFSVPAKLITEIIGKHEKCEVTDCSVRVDGGKYVFCAELEVASK